MGTTSPAGEDATTAEQQPDPNAHWVEAVVVQPAAMRQTGIVVMPNDDPQLLAAVRRYVMPDRRYMKLHGWNLKHMDVQRRHEFGRSLALDAAEITDSDLIVLLRGDWRARLTASWLIGMSLRNRFREILGRLLVDSDGCNDRKGMCFAFTRFGDSRDAEFLASYLRRSLSPGTSRCAQDWAMGGLLHLADHEEVPYLDDLLAPNGAWLQWLGSNQEPDTKDLVDFLCAFADSHAGPEPAIYGEEGLDLARSYAEWRQHLMPSGWRIIQDESERIQLDRDLIMNLDDGHPLRPARALSIAKCESCGSVLFNVRSGSGDWVVVERLEVEPRAFGSVTFRQFGTFDAFAGEVMGSGC